MKIIETVREMQVFADDQRRAGSTIALVPTMGYLHRGHLKLMEEGRKRSDCLVTSIYVNPTQFGPGEDFEKYPRDLERDEALAAEVGVDVIFYPPNAEMYPPHYQTYISVEGVTTNLCVKSRHGHFRGVTTVCANLVNIVKPHVTIFGKKDFQQLVTIKRMVTDLNMDLEVIGMPTVREDDGLAMSSRNTYLRDDEHESALSLSRSLVMVKNLYEVGERNAGTLIGEVTRFIEGHPHATIDYIKICDTTTMKDVDTIEGESVIALAVRVGIPRLIDNYVFGEPLQI